MGGFIQAMIGLVKPEAIINWFDNLVNGKKKKREEEVKALISEARDAIVKKDRAKIDEIFDKINKRVSR